MKTAKKLTALLIVLTLLFALSATAFATGTYSLKFYVNGTLQNWGFSANVGDSVYDAIDGHFDTDATFTQVYGGHYALTRIYDKTSTPCTTIPSGYTGTAVPGHPGYFELGTGDQGYHYLYAGYDWTYHYPSGADLWDYMDEHYPTAGSEIIVEYSLQITDWWSTYPIT